METVQVGQPGTTMQRQSNGGSASTINSDFETFLKMLTAQIENQDPLNPVDATDFATQLATFSSVEQQVLTNDLLTEMTGLLNGGALQQMGAWIGKEILVAEPAIYDGSPIELRPTYAHGTETAFLVVRNSAGDTVDRISVDMTKEKLTWNGNNDEGEAVQHGLYTFSIENFAKDVALDATVPGTYLAVQEVRTEDGVLIMELDGGITVTTDEVFGLRG